MTEESKDKILDLLETLDSIARDWDPYEGGLPVHMESRDRRRLVEAVEDWLRDHGLSLDSELPPHRG